MRTFSLWASLWLQFCAVCNKHGQGSPLAAAGTWSCRQQLVGNMRAQFFMLLQQPSSASSTLPAGVEHYHHVHAADD